jgi:nucleotide-binding universal stress UspA family protein
MRSMSLAMATAALPSWQNIAVFLDDTPEGETVGAHAVELARRYGAHVIGIDGLSRIPLGHPSDDFARGSEAIGSVINRHRAAEAQRVGAVGRCFTERALKQGVSPEFRVIRRDRGDDDDAVLNSLHCDLVVIGHPDPHGLPEGWSPDRLLMASGVPLLIIPDGWRSESIGTKILVCWNASREARRATADAMPFLSAARSVTVLVVDPAHRAHQHGAEPGADIALYLARHGAQVDVECATSAGASVADVILSRAAALGVDLIILGAYSHPRWAEVVFGGVTRTMLARMPIPVLVSR